MLEIIIGWMRIFAYAKWDAPIVPEEPLYTRAKFDDLLAAITDGRWAAYIEADGD